MNQEKMRTHNQMRDKIRDELFKEFLKEDKKRKGLDVSRK
jgi:hypothetical protein